MSDLQAIRERHNERNASEADGWAGDYNDYEWAHRDRATLLAEVDRLRALAMAVCDHSGFHTYPVETCEACALLTELREASK